MVRIKGSARNGASVYALNERTDDIVGKYTGATGVYDLQMAARIGDRIRVWQSVGTEDSQGVVVIVPDPEDDFSNFGGSSGE